LFQKQILPLNRILQKVDSLLHQNVTIRIDDDTELRLFQPDDAEELFHLTDSNRAHLRQWLPWVDSNQSIHDTRRFIQTVVEQFKANEGFQCGIWYQRQLAGVIGFHKIDWMNKNVEIGYWLGQSFEKKGLMTRSCRAMVDYAFNEFKLKRVQIRCATGNVKSCRVPERLGFRKEGLALQAEYLYGKFMDLVIYAMTDVEWSKLQQHRLPPQVVLSSANPADVETIDGIVRAMYESMIFSPPNLPDFERLRTLCYVGARFIPPTPPDGSRSFYYTEEFIARSLCHIEESGLRSKGFHESEIGRTTKVFGNIAHILSIFESRYSKDDLVPFARGVNSIQLLREHGRWWAVSVAWDIERPENPIPSEFLRP
jgi:ribosomal-protein-serine acetyltransferase